MGTVIWYGDGCIWLDRIIYGGALFVYYDDMFVNASWWSTLLDKRYR